MYGGLNYNPIAEFANLYNVYDAVSLLELPVPIFQPTDIPVPWCNTLWSCKREYWEALSLHIGSLAILDRNRRLFTRVVYQEIPALDVCCTTHKATIQLHSFGVDSNRLYGFFAPTSLTFGNRPVFLAREPRQETVKMASLLFSDNTDVSALVRLSELKETYDEGNPADAASD
jgi:hypothetical protein